MRFKEYGTVIISLITAALIIGVSWWTRSEIAWLYIFGIGTLLAGAWEVYAKRSK